LKGGPGAGYPHGVELGPPDLVEYARLAAPDRPQVLERLRAAAERGERDLRNTRIFRDASGALAAALHLVPMGSSVTLVVPFAGEDGALAALVPEALARARELGCRMVSFRPNVGVLGPRFRAALLESGFSELGQRIEFKTPLDALPLDDGTPLSWRAVGREEAAAMLARVAEGDPRGDEKNDDPHTAIEEFFSNPRLTRGPDWARITYMGVAPEARGKGLGAWVHKHGFRMLREQGGKLYHGGTSTANAPMLRLFRTHGCRETDRMYEFEWRPPR
jgi:GNAT superfamily N-acetyltransferase